MSIDYTNEWHSDSADRTMASAAAIVPIVHRLFAPKSVVDIGCGHGHWLRAWLDAGCDSVRGIDGDYIDAQQLVIPRECFETRDLNHPLTVRERFDLAVSIEVAEHLNPSSSEHFVASLCKLSDIVLFSAAIPGQPGRHHINTHWPHYWADQFSNHGYVALDFIRPQIWHNEDLRLCHRQNVLLFVHEDAASSDPWRGLPRLNCLTLVDVDILRDQWGVRASLKRMMKRVLP